MGLLYVIWPVGHERVRVLFFRCARQDLSQVKSPRDASVIRHIDGAGKPHIHRKKRVSDFP